MADTFDQPHTSWSGLADIAKNLYKGFGNNPRNKELADALLNVSGATPGVGDVQAGVMAANDLKNKKYASALLNGIGALPLIPAMGGMFIGKGSKVWNPNNEQLFMQLEKQGLSPEEIWSKTGTLRAPDKMLRQEISDVGSKFTNKSVQSLKDFGARKQESIFEHPELYNAYPHAKEITTLREYGSPYQGTHYPENDSIELGLPYKGKVDLESLKNLNLHELQHSIQDYENFAKGGSPENMGEYATKYNQAKTSFDEALKTRLDPNAGEIEKDNARQIMEHYGPQLSKLKEISNPIEAYRRLAGEAEARLTQNRMNLTPEERLKYYPYSQGQYGLDVPYEKLIVKK